MRQKRSKDFVPDPVEMLSVYLPGVGGRSTTCIGFILTKKDGFEAFTNDRSLGTFSSQRSAADALSKRSRGSTTIDRI